MHETITIRPKILYYGTPVVLVSTRNESGSTNLSPLSSAWALGDRVVLGFEASSHGLANLLRERECVISVPSPALWTHVEAIAATTGAAEVPAHKQAIGYRFVEDKFALSGLTGVRSEAVRPERVAECPLQLEARLVNAHPSDQPFVTAEVQVVLVHAHPSVVHVGTDHVDVTRFSPLLYVFRHYFGTGRELGRTFKAENPAARGMRAPAPADGPPAGRP